VKVAAIRGSSSSKAKKSAAGRVRQSTSVEAITVSQATPPINPELLLVAVIAGFQGLWSEEHTQQTRLGEWQQRQARFLAVEWLTHAVYG